MQSLHLAVQLSKDIMDWLSWISSHSKDLRHELRLTVQLSKDLMDWLSHYMVDDSDKAYSNVGPRYI